MTRSESMRSGDKHEAARIVACPRCGKGVPWGPQSPFRPFCSERCKLIDLVQWATEQHRIADESDPGAAELPENPGG